MPIALIIPSKKPNLKISLMSQRATVYMPVNIDFSPFLCYYMNKIIICMRKIFNEI